MAGLNRWLEQQPFEPLSVARETPSADGLTRKYLVEFGDGQRVESVLMGYPQRMTACLSSQVGCAMGCVFCATGYMGLKRNLRAGEIVAQALHLAGIAKEQSGQRLRNVVMMGMGEPLQNFDAVMAAMEVLTDTRALGIAHSRVGISTVGHVPGILKMARLERNYTLSVSLHAASDAEREPLVPLNKRWPLAELLDACRAYTEIRQRKIYFAWTLIHGVNDSDDHAIRLGRLLVGIHAHVNLIPLNPIDDYEHTAPEDERTARFHAILREESGLPVTLRQKRGIDVHAGCGQLAGK
jgi:23S rRNA (adenine2503-C2)-methyltransferase